MSFTAASLYPEIRRQAQDTAASPHTYTSAQVLQALNDALQIVWTRRPDAFYVSSIVTTAPEALASEEATVPVLDLWRHPLCIQTALLLLTDRVFDSSTRSAASSMQGDLENYYRGAERS